MPPKKVHRVITSGRVGVHTFFTKIFSDYGILETTSVEISVGEESASFTLTLVDDSIVEGVEIITFVMSQGDIIGIDEDAVDSNGKEAIVFIEDDDGIHF